MLPRLFVLLLCLGAALARKNHEFNKQREPDRLDCFLCQTITYTAKTQYFNKSLSDGDYIGSKDVRLFAAMDYACTIENLQKFSDKYDIRMRYLTTHCDGIKEAIEEHLETHVHNEEQLEEELRHLVCIEGRYCERLWRLLPHVEEDDLTRNTRLGEELLESLPKNNVNGTVTDSGVHVRFVHNGTGKIHPTLDDVVTVDMQIATVDHKALQRRDRHYFPNISVSEQVPGLREILLTMVKGDVRVIYVPPEMAYGDKGDKECGVTPGAWLVYDVELKGIKGKDEFYAKPLKVDPLDPHKNWSEEEKLEAALADRIRDQAERERQARQAMEGHDEL